MKTAIVTGLNGQDGSYLAEFLLEKGYKVIGTVRSKTPLWPYGFNPHVPNLEIMQVDVGYSESIRRLFLDAGHVDECYNLAAQSHVGYSFEHPEETYKVTGVGACLMMDEFFQNYPEGKFYQASSSEMFGNQLCPKGGFDLRCSFLPASPYGVAKVMAHYGARSYRDRGFFACSGVLFNHESPRRPDSFVTQKICAGAVIAKEWDETRGFDMPMLRLGNTSAQRDWGYAPEYVEIMWRILQNDVPDEWVVGTGQSITVGSFAYLAFKYVGLDFEDFLLQDTKSLLRPNDVKYLRADPFEANNLFDRPLTQVEGLVKIMMDHQLKVQGVSND